jgi:hypothetical protein
MKGNSNILFVHHQSENTHRSINRKQKEEKENRELIETIIITLFIY